MPGEPVDVTVDHAPEARTVRIAYFITSYIGSEQLLRLVRVLRASDPDSPVVIHHDDSVVALDPALFDSLGVHIITSDRQIKWGDLTLEAARWRVFRWIRRNLDANWVMLLSEQDYPIAPLGRLHNRLAHTSADAIMEAYRVDRIEDPAWRRELELRYYHQYSFLPRLGLDRRLPGAVRKSTAFLRKSAVAMFTRAQHKVFIYSTPPELDLPSRIGLRVSRTIFGDEFPCWYNNCWFALSATAIDHVLDYVDAHPEFVRYYERTVIPIESATATIMCNDPGLTVEFDALHAIRWTNASSGRPDVYSLDDLDFLVESNAIFARKFDHRNTAVLDALDTVVLGSATEV